MQISTFLHLTWYIFNLKKIANIFYGIQFRQLIITQGRYVRVNLGSK